jgi:hypothetical protein
MARLSDIKTNEITEDLGVSGSASPVVNAAALPTTGNTVGDFKITEDNKALYVWNGIEWDRIYSGAQENVEWTTEPPDLLKLSNNGSTSTLTGIASDPDSFPIHYTYDMNPSNPLQVTNVVNNSDGTYTLTPSTNENHAGSFIFRSKANDGTSVIKKSTTVDLSFVYSSIGAAYTAGKADGVYDFQVTGVNNDQPFSARYASYNNKGWIEILFCEVADRSHPFGGTSGSNYNANEAWDATSNSGWDNTKSHVIGYMKSHRNTVATMGPNATAAGGLDYTASSAFMMLGPNISATDILFTTKSSKTANGVAATGANQNSEYPALASTGITSASVRTQLIDYFTGNGRGFQAYSGWDNKTANLGITLTTRDNSARDPTHWMIVTGRTSSSTFFPNYGFRDDPTYGGSNVGNWEDTTTQKTYPISSTNVMSIWITDG